jgi:hypothetical protein
VCAFLLVFSCFCDILLVQACMLDNTEKENYSAFQETKIYAVCVCFVFHVVCAFLLVFSCLCDILLVQACMLDNAEKENYSTFQETKIYAVCVCVFFMWYLVN